jgi:hypothetical protein
VGADGLRLSAPTDTSTHRSAPQARKKVAHGVI